MEENLPTDVYLLMRMTSDTTKQLRAYLANKIEEWTLTSTPFVYKQTIFLYSFRRRWVDWVMEAKQPDNYEISNGFKPVHLSVRYSDYENTADKHVNKTSVYKNILEIGSI